MNRITNILAGLAIPILTIVSCASNNSVINRTRASLVRVEYGVPDEHGVCSGFVIKPKVVLTAAHCVGPLMTSDGLAATLLKADGYFDLAVLSVDVLKKQPLPIRDSVVVEQEELIAIGYAWGWAFPISNQVKVLIPSYSINPKSPMGIIVKGSYYHGMSGGPVVDMVGNVVGVVQQSNDGLGYGVGTTIIKAFLTDAGVN